MGGVLDAVLFLIGHQLLDQCFAFQRRIRILFAPGVVHIAQLFGADGAVRPAGDIALRLQEQLHVVGVLLHGFPVYARLVTFRKAEVVLHQPLQTLEGPEEDTLQFFAELVGKLGIIRPVRRLSLGGQDQLSAEEAVAPVEQRHQIAVGKRHDARRHPALIALLALAFQIHFAFRGDNGLHVVGLAQRLQPHVVVDHQQHMLQVGAGKSVFGNLPNAAILGVCAEQFGQHIADLAFPFTAAAFDHQHFLPGIAGDQTVADEFLKRGNVFRPQQVGDKTEPTLRRVRVRIEGDGQPVSDDLILFLGERSIQKQRAVLDVNAIRLRQQLFHLGCDPQGLHDVIHLFAHAGDNETLHHLIDDCAQRILIRHLSFHRKERVFRVCQPILFQKLAAEDRFIDRPACEPIRPPRLPDNLFLLRLFVFFTYHFSCQLLVFFHGFLLFILSCRDI